MLLYWFIRYNDLTGMVKRLASRINAVHLRSVQLEPDGVFYEANHLEGNRVNMPAVVLELLEEQHRRYKSKRSDYQLVFRPDHGHMMLDDFNRLPPTCPGYPLFGRLRGLAELRGVQTAISYMRMMR